MKTDLKKQLESASHAIDLIKISQRAQHTSIKEALTKMLRCISMIAEETKGKSTDIIQKSAQDMIEKAQKIADDRRDKDESWNRKEK